ncbi:hypothetical protein [Ectobacillus funiculus]|uniref:Transposase IS204/IS1001/IS1096/IS1165 DDE domain-containing protein n=1 Tax=Ectobacillus funiculus TaxID=137993 RepID=A0ABV5WAW3_9BACI
MVSRDSSFPFKKATDEANSNIIQISDRFHIVQSLRKTTESVLKKLVPAHFSLQIQTRGDDEISIFHFVR